MICRKLEFENYRNIVSPSVNFEDGANVISGMNAQGKTNILEAVYFFARGKSFRATSSRELIEYSADEAKIACTFRRDSDSYDTVLSCDIPKNGKKTYYKNSARLSGIFEMMGVFRAVLFCPAHLALVAGSPSVRRSFLDCALCQLDGVYLHNLARYNHILAERNQMLKNISGGAKPDSELIGTYASLLADTGAYIAARRHEYTEMVNESVTELFSAMTGGAEKPLLTYEPGIPELDSGFSGDTGFMKTSLSPGIIERALTDNIERECRYQATLYGVHRDDISIKLSGRDAKLYASQGQRRSLAVAMKLAEGDIAKSIDGEYPVMLLDDVMSELDIARREFILRELSGRQLIVTSCEDNIANGVRDVNVINVRDGQAE